MNITTFRKSVRTSTENAYEWFNQRCTKKEKKDWIARDKLDDSGIGAIYAFFDSKGECLYVGQTTQGLKQRANSQKSKHYDSGWWEKWETLKFINLANRSDQIFLETLLIINLQPQYNTKPGAREINKMFGA